MKSGIISAIILAAIIFIAGCTSANQGTSGETKKDLTSSITPARDLSGVWEGSGTWHDNVANPACSYEGVIRFNFVQTGNQLAGTFQTTITKADQLLQSVPCSTTGQNQPVQLAGAVSSTRAQFTAWVIDFDATFTTDLMDGTFESCPGQVCSDGSRATGSVGRFSVLRKG